MSATEVFRRILGILDRVRIPYMLTGSFASSFHGVPRATQDIDLVIAPTSDQLRELVASLPPEEFYVDLEAVLDAQRREGQFNVIDFATGWKLDLIVRKSRAFSRREFERRLIVDFEGMRLVVATPEDVIIAKLEWAKAGGSQRQIEDVAGLLRICAGELDREYLRHWVGELELDREWSEAVLLSQGPA